MHNRCSFHTNKDKYSSVYSIITIHEIHSKSKFSETKKIQAFTITALTDLFDISKHVISDELKCYLQ